MGSKRVIIVNGSYIAEQHVETQILHAENVYEGSVRNIVSRETEDVEAVDTSFFGTDRYGADVCEKNLREAINGSSGKADACRRIMIADRCGYIHIRQYSDVRKAELINPFAKPKYTFTGEDFKKSRNRPVN